MTTFPSPSAEPPTTRHDVRRWLWQGFALGVAFLALFALVTELLGLPTE